MTRRNQRPLAVAAVVAVALWSAAQATAQTVELMPLGGYRFGGGFFEVVSNQPVDLDGAPAIGGALGISMGDGLWFEALFTRQEARVPVRGGTFDPPASWRIRVDHWQAGGRQEFGIGRVRPFLTGLLGLTRYAAEGDEELRFTIGAGGGARVLLGRRLGVRFDSRVFTTFVEADGRVVACSPGICLVGIHANIVWQLEFSAGLVVAF